MSSEPTAEIAARLRELPRVDEVVEHLRGEHLQATRVDAARAAIDHVRARIRAGGDGTSLDEVVEIATARLQRAARALIQTVINATGVLIHTNLGRVPLGDKQVAEVQNVVTSYTNLEYDLHEGHRGDRYGHAVGMLAHLTGAEDAVIVNNNAAAVMLVLSSLCGDREVVISRGELVEIGGEFRIPDVMNISRARLVEVGTTNRTHLADYERAIRPETAALMKVHASNYKIVGFTKAVERRELVRLARGRGVLMLEDLGSGLVVEDDALVWAHGEPSVRSSLADGVDVVTFSGDKLFGGPQAGIIVGRAELIGRIKRDPLLRALRVDKMTLAALQATLETYLDGAWRELPFWRMATEAAEAVEQRARAVIHEVEAHVSVLAKLEVVPSTKARSRCSQPVWLRWSANPARRPERGPRNERSDRGRRSLLSFTPRGVAPEAMGWEVRSPLVTPLSAGGD